MISEVAAVADVPVAEVVVAVVAVVDLMENQILYLDYLVVFPAVAVAVAVVVAMALVLSLRCLVLDIQLVDLKWIVF